MSADPLEPCQSYPACKRRSYSYDVPPDSLFLLVEAALVTLKPESMSVVDTHHIRSVHRVWFFRDDLDALVAASGSGSVLHLRSSSRVGGWDFGVNGRRLDRLVRELDELVAAAGR